MTQDYRGLRKMMKIDACNEGVECLLALLREEDLQRLNLSNELMSRIHEIQMTDDYVGKGVATLMVHLGSGDLTYTDKIVSVQVLATASNAILKGRPVTKYLFDSKNILQALPILDKIGSISPNSPDVGRLTGDAFDENMMATMDYIDQYNRDLVDHTVRYFQSGKVNDSEEAQDRSWWKDVFSYLNITY